MTHLARLHPLLHQASSFHPFLLFLLILLFLAALALLIGILVHPHFNKLEHDLRSAYASGRITSEEYEERRVKLGLK